MTVQARVSEHWVRSAVVYEVNTRNFSADGDFAGVTARLDDLTQLGVTVIWLMPVHPIGVLNRKGTFGSPYSVRDFYAIDPAFGTAEDLRKMIAQAHSLGLKVIIDIVADHASWDSVMMAHPEFWTRDGGGKIISPVPDWTDVAGLDYGNRALRDYMIAMLQYWLREFDLDGFRCDVAGMVPIDFWNEARVAMERVNPSLFMLAEWHSPDLLLQAFDAVYAWPFHKALHAVFMEGASATQLRDTWRKDREAMPEGALELRFSDNHDEKRAIARFGERGALAASVLVFMLDGIPLLYNGQEVADTAESGAPALFERVSISWDKGDCRAFYRQLIALRRAHSALQQGPVEWLDGPDSDRVTRFARGAFTVTINCSNRPAGEFNAWGARVTGAAGETLLELL